MPAQCHDQRGAIVEGLTYATCANTSVDNLQPTRGTDDLKTNFSRWPRRCSPGCLQHGSTGPVRPSDGLDLAGWYIGYAPDEPHNIPLVDKSKMDEKFVRQTVPYKGSERAGTVVVDIDDRMLYYVNGDGPGYPVRSRCRQAGLFMARYGDRGAQGRVAGLASHADHDAHRPELPTYVEAGLDNPLGARAMLSLLPRTGTTSSSASTARTSPGASESRSRAAASAS